MAPRLWIAVGERTRGWWALGCVAVVLAALLLVAVTGSREPARAVRLIPGTAWLDDSAIGAVSHVFGYSATAEDPVSIDPTSGSLTVVQAPGGGYVLDGRTGILRRVGGISAGVATGRGLVGSPGDLRVLTTGVATWSVDRRSGLAQQLDPASLSPVGPPVPTGAPLGDVTTDADGDLWAVVSSRGAVVEIRPGGASHALTIGRVGDPLQLAATDNGVWAADAALHELLPLEGQSSDTLPLPDTAISPVIAAAPDSPHVIAVADGRATDLDTSTDVESETGGADLHGVAVGVVASGRAYLLDPVDRRVDIMNLDAFRIEAAVPVPVGADELIARDHLVFVNASATPDAAVIDGHDHVTSFLKYHPTPGTVTPHSVPVPEPDAATAGLITGGPGTGAGPGAGGGRGAPPAPARPSPPALAPAAGPLPGAGDPGPDLPALPVGVVATTTASGQIEVTWQPGTGGLPAVNYQVLLAPTDTSAAPPAQELTGLRASFKDLTPSVSYCPRVQAVSASGVGSGFQSGKCIGAGATRPSSAPTDVQVVPAGGGVSVTFGPAPDVPPGTTYTVTVNGTPTAEPDAAVHFISVPVGDQPSVNVTVTVQAGNDGGQGPASQAVTSFAYAAQSPIACRNASTGAVTETLAASCPDGADAFRRQSWRTLPADAGVPVGVSFGDEVLCSGTPAAATSGPPLVAWGLASPSGGCPAVDAVPTEPREVVWSQPGGSHTTRVVIVPVTITGNGATMDLLCGATEALAACADEPVTPDGPGTSYYADAAG